MMYNFSIQKKLNELKAKIANCLQLHRHSTECMVKLKKKIEKEFKSVEGEGQSEFKGERACMANMFSLKQNY